MPTQELHLADIAHVVRLTGCSEEVVKNDLIANEWNLWWTITTIRDAQARGLPAYEQQL